MNGGESTFSRLARISGVLLILGLAVEAVSLHWVHPIAFIVFVLGGGIFLVAGVLVFLYAVVFESSPANPNNSRAN
jgi:hypothetical protein